jgi:AraC-like DNA-binding protein
MLEPQNPEVAEIDLGVHDTGTAMIRVDVLQKFPELVAELGGDVTALLSKAQIDPGAVTNRHAVIPHRAYVRLLERAAADLSCPDFGMRLAAVQGGIKVLGPVGYVMRNSRTVREAFRYCIDYTHAYSTAMNINFEKPRTEGSALLRIELLLARLPKHPQTLERILLMMQHSVLTISSGQVKAREIWFTHQPLSPLSTYRGYFGADVRFGQRMNGLLFADSDLDMPVPKADQQVYELARNFIEQRLPATDSVFTPRIRTIVERLLLEGTCTYSNVASILGMHPRALQRRLRAEGESFEAIKDGVRREIALRYLKESSMPLIRVAKMLGYSETSALSRSCYRWFSASPRQVRGSLRG